MPFSNLTPSELEAMALLAEELAEAGQVIGKILRHGFDSCHPSGGRDNRALLEDELGDVRAAVRILIDLSLLQEHHIEAAADDKRGRVSKFLHHIEIIGTRAVVKRGQP